MINFLGLHKQNIKDNNKHFTEFDRLDNDNDQNRESVLNDFFQKDDQPGFGYNSTSYVNFVYGAISTNKPIRLGNYRQMASFPEVGDALDEIADGFINFDENGKCVNLKLNQRFEGLAYQEIENAWEEYISLFDFESNGFEFMRKLTIDAELCWENIIDEKHKDLGIIGINYLKPESYEFGIDVVRSKKVGIVVFMIMNDVNLDDQHQNPVNKDNQSVQGGIKISDLNFADKIREGNAVLLPWEQITYVDTGIYSSDGLMVYPVLERARKAYNQLSLIEDSIIIYRLVRAPERLVFNVDTGTLPRQRAEQEVLKLMKRYQTKKVYNPITGSVTNDYDPHQMSENFWFPKPAGSGGTDVNTLQTSANLGELEDLHYFLRKLYLSLKVPFNRYTEPTVQVERSDSINYEEYRFAKFIMRLGTCFSKGLVNGFKTHLKLKGLWHQHKIKENDIKVVFVPPSSFELYEMQKLLEVKLSNYSNVVGNDEFAKEPAMKKYLNMSEDEITANNNQLEKEKIRTAMIAFKVANIEDHGTPEPEGEEEDFGGDEENAGSFATGDEETETGGEETGSSDLPDKGFGEV